MPADKLEEWWDIYDQAEHKIGQRQRSETLRTGEYHLVANIFYLIKPVKCSYNSGLLIN